MDDGINIDIAVEFDDEKRVGNDVGYTVEMDDGINVGIAVGFDDEKRVGNDVE
jgi:hypothetical protein